MVPKLVGEMEKLELMVVKLTKKTDVDVLRFLKRATNRDFRIKATDVAAALAKRAREEEEEGGGGGGGRPVKKKKGKAKKSAAPKKKKKSGGAAMRRTSESRRSGRDAEGAAA